MFRDESYIYIYIIRYIYLQYVYPKGEINIASFAQEFGNRDNSDGIPRCWLVGNEWEKFIHWTLSPGPGNGILGQMQATKYSAALTYKSRPFLVGRTY